jgi:predicted hotdog family 3-hydroxylacyl-ACP dehydratase
MIDRNWIAAHIPHQGSMCLLDSVESWDDDEICCRADSHRDPANPLRAAGRLGISAAIEYAAQAMALHGALRTAADSAPRAGYLASVRDVRWQRSRFDDIDAPLHIRATRLSGNELTVMYQFELAGDEPFISGRASVILDAAPFAPAQERPA